MILLHLLDWRSQAKRSRSHPPEEWETHVPYAGKP